MFCSSCGNQLHETYVFCPICGRMAGNPEAQSVANDQEEQAIESYFLGGYEYEPILCFLSKYHGTYYSMSMLKRRLRGIWFEKKKCC